MQEGNAEQPHDAHDPAFNTPMNFKRLSMMLDSQHWNPSKLGPGRRILFIRPDTQSILLLLRLNRELAGSEQ